MQTHTFIIKRGKEARAQFGIAQSTFYEWIGAGLMPPGIALGCRSVGWPAHELDTLAAARIAGKTEDEIRALVRDLVAARADAAKRFSPASSSAAARSCCGGLCQTPA